MVLQGNAMKESQMRAKPSSHSTQRLPNQSPAHVS